MNGVRKQHRGLGLSAFSGDWNLTRRISDALAGAEGRFDGIARFLPDGAALRCEERGRLVYAGHAPMEASRVSIWREEAEGGRIVVDHDDGRPFHAFDLVPLAEAEHHCAADLYRVVYDFSAWPRWRATWRVSGPRKNYVSVSDYRPIDGPA